MTAAVTPRGSWEVPLPRLGVALSLAGEDGELESRRPETDALAKRVRSYHLAWPSY